MEKNLSQEPSLKVVAINGSPRKNGNTAEALGVMAQTLKQQGIAVETIQVGHLPILGCAACGRCASTEGHFCVFSNDIVNEAAAKMRSADGIILASPTYYAGIAGSMKCFLDRVFYTSSSFFAFKAATSMTVARRAGGVDALHQLNNYLHLAQTVTPPSQYWTSAYGGAPADVLQDSEGLQTLRRNALSLAWLLRVLSAGRSIALPVDGDKRVRTSFIR